MTSYYANTREFMANKFLKAVSGPKPEVFYVRKTPVLPRNTSRYAPKTSVCATRREPRRLLDLPDDVLRLIVSELVEEKYEDIEISPQRRIPKECYGRKWKSNQPPDLSLFFRAANFLSCSKRSRDVVLESFEACNTFFSDSTEGFRRLPKLMRLKKCTYIRKLSLRMEDFTKTHDEEVYPGVLDVLCNYLRQLHELTLFSEVPQQNMSDKFSDHRDQKYASEPRRGPEHAFNHRDQTCEPEAARSEQEIRALVRLMAFVVLRHPNLKRMILPAESGVNSDPEDPSRKTEYLLIADNQRLDCKFKPKDLILNHTALALVPWPELAFVNLSEYGIESEPEFGSARHTYNKYMLNIPGYFTPVVERAYRLGPYRRSQGWQHHGVDFLIRKCRELADDPRAFVPLPSIEYRDRELDMWLKESQAHTARMKLDAAGEDESIKKLNRGARLKKKIRESTETAT